MDYANAAPLQAARDNIQKGWYQSAWYILDQLVKNGPADAEAYYLMSTITSDEREQINLLRKALEIDPYHPLARNLLSELQRTSKPTDDLPNRNLLSELRRTSKPDGYPSNISSGLKKGSASIIKESWNILSEAIVELWKVLKPMFTVPSLLSPSDAYAPDQANASTFSTNFTPESNASAESSVIASLPQGVWMTNKGISYKLTIASGIPFINKGEEYGYSPIQHINAVEIKIKRAIPRWLLLTSGFAVVFFYIGYYIYRILITNMSQYSYSYIRFIDLNDLVLPICILIGLFIASLMTNKFITIYSAGSLLVSVNINYSEKKAKHFLETYLQLSSSKYSSKESQ